MLADLGGAEVIRWDVVAPHVGWERAGVIGLIVGQ